MDAQYSQKENAKFGAEIARILPLIMREFTKRQKNIFSKGFLSVPQVVILHFLVERGSCKMNELARALNFSMSAVTAIVDKMIRLKLVTRERSSEDRRVVNVIILKKGKETAGQVSAARQDCANSLFSVLTEKDKSVYLRILRKVHTNIKQRQ